MLEDFRRRMDALFDGLDRGGLAASTATWPRVNLYDAGARMVLEAELPGVSRDDLDVTVTQDSLTLSGTRKTAVPEGYSVHRRERGDVQFTRSFSLRDPVDPEKVSAVLRDGVLTLTLEKIPEAQPRKIALGQ